MLRPNSPGSVMRRSRASRVVSHSCLDRLPRRVPALLLRSLRRTEPVAVGADHIALRDFSDDPLVARTDYPRADVELLGLGVKVVELHDVVRVADSAVGAGLVLGFQYGG